MQQEKVFEVEGSFVELFDVLSGQFRVWTSRIPGLKILESNVYCWNTNPAERFPNAARLTVQYEVKGKKLLDAEWRGVLIPHEPLDLVVLNMMPAHLAQMFKHTKGLGTPEVQSFIWWRSNIEEGMVCASCSLIIRQRGLLTGMIRIGRFVRSIFSPRLGSLRGELARLERKVVPFVPRPSAL